MDWSISLLTLEQVIILSAYLGCGYLFLRRKLFTPQGLLDLTNLVLYLLTPATILGAFMAVKLQPEILKGIVLAAIFAVLTHLLGIVIGRWRFRDQEAKAAIILRFALVFSNAGFFTLPLLRAIFGSEGLLYGSIYVGFFNIFCWTYGVLLMQGGSQSQGFQLKQIRPLFKNPNLIAIGIGLLLFFTQIELPRIPAAVLSSFGATYGPVAMVLLGAQIASFKVDGLFKDRSLQALVLWRNLLIPLLVSLLALPFCLHDRVLYLAIVLPAAAPVAGNTAFFATKYGQDEALSVRSVTLSTMAALLSIPFLMAIATSLFSLAQHLRP